MRRQATLDRMQNRVNSLIAEFECYVEVFNNANLFAGPSVYFHIKTLTVLREYDLPCQEIAFKEIYPYFHKIAVSCEREIEPHLGNRMNTSKTKVIDNAIVGFIRVNLD